MSSVSAQRHRWTRQEYDRMVSRGVFDPEVRLELINGEIVNVTPQGSLHATSVRLAEEALRAAFVKGFDVRIQMPLALDDASEPEPDIAVVVGIPRDYRDAHPRTACLIVEVAETTLAFDRGSKKELYARNRIEEYWLINLVDAHIEVYRQPHGTDFQSRQILRSGETVSPLAASNAAIPVADLLP